mmetsp:Transcript_116151/g.339671  ORF Transcript_116151/g.339671 Transcript_116151/m.339671 type:complete len:414 (-) Transcript_116151:268-1509(-)
MLAADDNAAPQESAAPAVAAVPAPAAAAAEASAVPAPAAAAPEASAEPVHSAPAAALPADPVGDAPAAPSSDVAASPPLVEATALPSAGGEAAPTAAPVGSETAEAQPESAPDAAGDNSGGGGGLMGRIKENVGRVSEMQSVKKSMEFVVDTSKAVGQKVSESERVQQGVEFVKKKTAELAESERVQRGLGMAKDTAKAVSEKTHKGLEVVSEKTQMGLEYAREKTRAVREGAGTVWEKGRGSIQRAKASVGKVAWRGSARETLDMAAQEEQWRGIKVQGAEEISVPARTEHTSAYYVPKGSTLRWTFRVKDHDIGFGVRMRVQEWGGSREEEVLGIERYDSNDTISGSWVADENRTIVLAFDNRYSRLRSKTVAFLVGTEKPPVFAEPPTEATMSTSSSTTEVPPAEPKPIV